MCVLVVGQRPGLVQLLELSEILGDALVRRAGGPRDGCRWFGSGNQIDHDPGDGKEDHGEHLFSRYGFLDAVNPTFTLDVPVQHGRVVPGRGWYDTDYLGIDQGPILAMIENYRTGLIWKTMRRNPHVVRGLKAAGFSGGWLLSEEASDD